MWNVGSVSLKTAYCGTVYFFRAKHVHGWLFAWKGSSSSVSTAIFEQKYPPILCEYRMLQCYETKRRRNMRSESPKNVITFCSEINNWQVITIYILLMTGVLQMLSHSRRWLGPPLVASQQWQMREALVFFVWADVSVCFRFLCDFIYIYILFFVYIFFYLLLCPDHVFIGFQGALKLQDLQSLPYYALLQ